MTELLQEIRDKIGEEAFEDICFKYPGERLVIPYRQKPVIATNIKRLLNSGYSVDQIVEHLGCSRQYVYKIKRQFSQFGEMKCPED